MSTQNTKSDAAAAAAAAPNEECTSTEMLFESAVAGRWNELSSFCNSYTHSPDTPLNPNPLFAAVLHTAILMAAKPKSTTIFADTPPKELVTSVGLAIGGADFCPYKFDESDQDASFRRRAIAQLCRICPGWISAPLVGHCEDNEDIANRTTALHLAVRMRNPSLVKLFLKYCPEASKVQDDLGYLPLHYAVRPVDEVVVYSKAVLAHSSRTNVSNNSLIGPADLPNIQNMDVGGGTAGGVSFGMRMVHRGKHMLGGINDICMLSRHRLRREMLEKKRKCIASKKRLNAINGRARTKAADKAGESSDNTSSSKSNEGNSSSKTNHHSARRSSRIKKNDDLQQAKATQYLLFSNLYTSSSSLVRAMMFIGCVDEDSPKFIEAENHACASEYPVISGSRGKIRQSRAWKSESHRVEVVRMLLDAYPQGMGVACNSDPEVKDEDLPKELLGGGGETPLIMAVRTFKGGGPEEDEEEDFNMDMMNLDAVGGPNNNAAAGAVAGGGNIGGGNVMMNAGPINDAPADVNIAAAPNENVANSVAEEDAEYEMGLPSVERNDGPVEDNANNQVPQAPQDNINEGEQIEDLELIRILIRTATRINDFSAFSRTNDDGDTSLHAAVRIGAHHRVVTLLLNAYPEAASMLANDAATPLHLLLRRCSHLAPEGVGSLSTYNVDMVQAMINASGDSVMTLPNSDSRTPLHEAVYYGASPDVLDTLANRPAGRIALLLRDCEGHTPLGAYCRHAADFYGMRVLVNLCPNAAAALGDGKRVALHRVLASFNLAVNVDVLNLLGTAYPRGVNLKDSHKMTPLALLCQSYKGPMNVDLPKLLTNRTSLGRCLSNKVMLMAKYLILNGRANRDWTASQTRIENGEEIAPKERLLHAALRDPATSVEIVKLATVLDPAQHKEVDEEGNTPLHLCCFRESGCTEDTVFEEVHDTYPSDDDSVYKAVNNKIDINPDPLPLETSEGSGKRLLLEDQVYDPTASFIRILHAVLYIDRAAARKRNNDGKFPFTVLVERGASWKGGGMDQVFKANPAAIFSFNLNLSNTVVAMAMGRVSRPSETSPIMQKEEEAACLGAMFELLKGKPTVLEGANIDLLGDPKAANRRGTRRSKRLRTH